ncbi:hypothetical protein MMPV_002640 [Pyropia vietnamensis]
MTRRARRRGGAAAIMMVAAIALVVGGSGGGVAGHHLTLNVQQFLPQEVIDAAATVTPRPLPTPSPVDRRQLRRPYPPGVRGTRSAVKTPFSPTLAPEVIRFLPFLDTYKVSSASLPAANCGGATTLTLSAVERPPSDAAAAAGILRVPHTAISMDGEACGTHGADASEPGYLTLLPASAIGYVDRATALGVKSTRDAIFGHPAAAAVFAVLWSTAEFWVGHEASGARVCGEGDAGSTRGAPAGQLSLWHAPLTGWVRYDGTMLGGGLNVSLPPGERAVSTFAPLNGGGDGTDGDGNAFAAPKAGACLWVDAQSRFFQNRNEGAGDGRDTPGGAACFPATAVVALANGSTAAMADLATGDVVCTAPRLGGEGQSVSTSSCADGGGGSAVHAWSHRDVTAAATFTRLVWARLPASIAAGTSSPSTKTGAGRSSIPMTGSLMLSPGHLLPIPPTGTLVAARRLHVGSLVTLADGSIGTITATESGVAGTGLYNPHTTVGSLVVDGVAVSAYTEAVPAAAAHVALGVARAAWRGSA